jgi:hypothetical protein
MNIKWTERFLRLQMYLNLLKIIHDGNFRGSFYVPFEWVINTEEDEKVEVEVDQKGETLQIA